MKAESGIKILSKTPICHYTYLSCVLVCIGLAIMFCSIFFYSQKIKQELKQNKGESVKKYMRHFWICFIMGGIVMISSVFQISPIYKPTGRYQYKCTIDETVSAKWLEDEYEIKSVENGIWILEKRGSEEVDGV